MYLISTPNGRRILKEISEGGIEKLADYIDLEKLDEIKETIGNNFEFNESDFEGIEQDAKQDMEATKKRRFFKGIRRR